MNMLRIARALREEDAMRVPTGPKVRQFEEQYQRFDAELLSRRLASRANRQRALRNRCRNTLQHIAGMVFFILRYFQMYPIMAVADFFLDVARSRIYKRVCTHRPMLEAVLGKSPDLLKGQVSLPAEFVKALFEVWRVPLDTTEHPRIRYRCLQKQRQYYLDKKQRCTLKNPS